MIVDASVWVSVLLTEDVHHARSRLWLGRQMADPPGILIMPVLVLAEVAGAVIRRTGREGLARQAIDDIMDASQVRLVPMDASLGRDAALLAITHRLRGADAVYAVVADRLGLPLVTLDQEMRDRLAGLINVVEP